MFLTVTPDPVLDKVFIIEEWTPDTPMRALRTTTSVGGKGLDASVALSHLGQPSVGLAFLAGPTGIELAQLVEAYGIRLEAIWAGGVTRTAHLISEIKHSRTSHLFTGDLEIKGEHLDEFNRRFKAHLPQADWMICGGKVPQALPSEFFLPLVREAVETGIPVLIDSFSGYLRPVLAARPTVVKMNRKEFEWTFGEPVENREGLRQAAEKVYRSHDLHTLVITCGEQGILGLTPEGAFQAIPPRLKAVNTAGAGDAASAAIAWRQASGDSWEETLRWAAAVSAAVVLTEGTADCRMEDIQNIYPQVRVLDVGG